MTPIISDDYDATSYQRLKAFADTKETPFLVVDTSVVAEQYDELLTAFPFAKVSYAVKANPSPELIDVLKDKGSSFDIASIYELARALAAGVTPERLSFGNTIKKPKVSALSTTRAYACTSPIQKRTCATSPRSHPALRSMFGY